MTTRSKSSAAEAKTAKKLAKDVTQEPEAPVEATKSKAPPKQKAESTKKQTKKSKADNAKQEAPAEDPTQAPTPAPNQAPNQATAPTPNQAPTQAPSHDPPISNTGTFPLKFWNGNMPEAKGTIAKVLSQTPMKAQIKQALDLARFLAEDRADHRLLNLETTITPSILAVPGSGQRNVRVVYGLGTGAGATGIRDNPLKSNFPVLTGEIEDGIQVPQVMTLPSNVLQPQQFKVPTEATIESKRCDPNQDKPSNWFNQHHLTETRHLPMLMPIPAFLVLDAIEGDIDALKIYERWMFTKKSLEESEDLTEININIVCFIAAILANSKENPSIKLKQTVFVNSPSPVANYWKKNRIQQLFHEVINTTPVEANPHLFSATELAQAMVNAATAKSAKNETSEITRSNARNEEREALMDDEGDSIAKLASTFKLSREAFQKLLIMCDLREDQVDEIPSIWKLLAEKNASTADKLAIARNHIAANTYWREAKVKPLHTILNMTIKRTFEEETSMSTIKSAANGLTPFAVPCMSEMEVEDHNEQAAALAQATSTTVKDHTLTKLKAKGPTSFEEMLKQIKTFANLLFALFGQYCPLYRECMELVEDLEDYLETARNNTSRKTMASILWILHLQSRHFSAANMEGNGALLASYRYMANCVRTTQPVLNGDVPEELYSNPNKRARNNNNDSSGGGSQSRNRDNNRRDPNHYFDKSYDHPPFNREHQNNNRYNDRYNNNNFGVNDIRRYYGKGGEAHYNGGEPPYKRQKIEIVDQPNYHPKLKEAVKPLRGQGRLPRVMDICRACNIRSEQLFPNKQLICIKATLFGTCFASCPRQHTAITDKEAEHAIKLLQPVLQDPSKIQVNKYYVN